jgi:hypothetical protein
MKTLSLKKIASCLTKRKKEQRKLSQLNIENFDLTEFLFHRENRN